MFRDNIPPERRSSCAGVKVASSLTTCIRKFLVVRSVEASWPNTALRATYGARVSGTAADKFRRLCSTGIPNVISTVYVMSFLGVAYHCPPLGHVNCVALAMALSL
jgi:hypothetical protein